MKRKIFLFAAGLIFIAAGSFAQQNAQYNQYIFNALVINPAYAGVKGIWNANAIYTQQWVGMPGAPTTQSISFEGPVSDEMGLGIDLVNDQIGAQSQQSLFGSYSYKLKLNEKYKLSMGLAVGGSYFGVDGTKMTTDMQVDPAVPRTNISQLRFDSKAGLFFYSERYYAGFSVSDLTANLFNSSNLFLIPQSRHCYLTSGYVFDIAEKWKFKPSALFKFAPKSPTNIDVNAYVLYNDKFWIGAIYSFGANIGDNNLDRSLSPKDAVVFMMDYYITERFRLGYAYTMTTGLLKDYASHEISLGYYIPSKTLIKKTIDVRYF